MAVKKIGDDKDVPRQVTCRRCGSILEYLPVDIKKRTYTDYSGTPDTDYWIECPQCAHKVTVSP